MSFDGGRMFLQRRARTRWTVKQFSTAIGTTIVKRIGALCTEGALERTDESARLIGRQIATATLAIGAHLQHRVVFSVERKARKARSCCVWS
jgi:hypothetical protein